MNRGTMRCMKAALCTPLVAMAPAFSAQAEVGAAGVGMQEAHQAAGRITSVEAEAGRFTVAPRVAVHASAGPSGAQDPAAESGKLEPLTFSVAEGAEILEGSRRLELSDLEVGDTVVVHYATQAGRHVAETIRVGGPSSDWRN